MVGALVGAAIAYSAPRLVAYRLEEPPEQPGAGLLIPLAGPWLVRVSPYRALALQLLAAAVFAGLAAHEGWNWKLPLAAIYSAILIAIAYVDIDYRLVLNRLSYSGTVIGLAGSLLWPGFSDWVHPLNAAAGALAGLSIFGALQLIGRGALGTGDTKLAVMIGAMRGLPGVLSALVWGVLLGGLAAIIFLVVLRRGRKTYIAYAPYLAAGAVLSFFLNGP